MDLICSLYSWWESFGSSSLATLPLGFNCGFISTSACGSSTGVYSWGCPGGLGFAPVRARCGGGAWVAGVLAAPGTQGSWWPGQQEICSRRLWQPVLANALQYSCLETAPSLTEKPGRPQSTGSQRVKHYWSDPARKVARLLLPVAALPQWELIMKVAQLLDLWGPWWHQVCRDTDCLCRRSYGPIRVFFQASCSWWSEGLFGQSFSVAPPIQALRGLPCLGVLFCCLHVRHLKRHPAWGPTLYFGASVT